MARVKKTTSYADKLREGKEAYKAGQAFENQTFTKIDPGTYMADLSLAEFRMSSNDNLMLHREHIITEGEYKGRKVFDNMVYGVHEIGTGMLRGFIKAALNLDELSDDPADLEELVAEINNKGYSCKLRIQDQIDSDFQRITVLEIFDKEESDENIPEPEPEPETGSEPDEDDSLKKLLDFCENNEVEISAKKKNDRDFIVKEIGEYNYENLDDDEKELLEELGLEDRIVKKTAKKKR